MNSSLETNNICRAKNVGFNVIGYDIMLNKLVPFEGKITPEDINDLKKNHCTIFDSKLHFIGDLLRKLMVCIDGKTSLLCSTRNLHKKISNNPGFTVKSFMVGIEINKLWDPPAMEPYIDIEKLLCNLHILYTKQVLCDKCLYMSLCLLVHESKKLEDYAEDIVRYEFTQQECPEGFKLETLQILQQRYARTGDIKIKYMINMIIRQSTASYIRTSSAIASKYIYGDLLTSERTSQICINSMYDTTIHNIHDVGKTTELVKKDYFLSSWNRQQYTEDMTVDQKEELAVDVAYYFIGKFAYPRLALYISIAFQYESYSEVKGLDIDKLHKQLVIGDIDPHYEIIAKITHTAKIRSCLRGNRLSVYQNVQ